MSDRTPTERQLLEEVARAHRARRGRDAARRLWTIAPTGAAACLALAAAGRVAGWTPLVTLFALGGAALALAVYVVAAKHGRSVSDAEVSCIDADANLQGELRSAHWFVEASDRDDWIRFHLARAAERVRGMDWAALYPAPTARRAKLLTAAMAAAAVLLAIAVPGGTGVAASGTRGKTASIGRPGVILALPPDVRKQLEEMLVKAESRTGRALTASEVRDLLARLDELAHSDPSKQADPAATAPGKPPDATKADLKALAERAKKASESTSLEPAVRDALSDVADKLGEGDQNANAMSSRDPEDAAAKADATGDVQQSKSGSGKQDGSSVQSVKEAAGGSGVGVVMMTTDETSNARDGGLGLGGGSSDRNGGGHMADLGAALRKETIEASADLAGENVHTEQRRQTEHADAGAAFTHAAGQPAERGNSTAPPPVPESRRAAVKSYFIRKQ
jgi:hypothetical protein